MSFKILTPFCSKHALKLESSKMSPWLASFIFPNKQIFECKMQQLCGEVYSVFVAAEPKHNKQALPKTHPQKNNNNKRNPRQYQTRSAHFITVVFAGHVEKQTQREPCALFCQSRTLLMLPLILSAKNLSQALWGLSAILPVFTEFKSLFLAATFMWPNQAGRFKKRVKNHSKHFNRRSVHRFLKSAD